MANERSSPWVDWTEIDFPSVLWITSAASWPFTAAPLANTAPDVLDPLANPSVQGGATSKPSFAGGSEATINAGYMHQIAIPDSVINKQRERVVWDGIAGVPMDDSASDRIALEIDNFLAFTVNSAAILVPFKLSAKFRGYGAPIGGDQTEDVYVGPVGFGQAVSAFPLMAITLAPVLVSPGVFIARIRHLIEIPDTVGPGDVVEIVTLAQFGSIFSHGLSWQTARYRFVKPPYEIDPNTGLQLTGTEGQPRTDESTFLP